MTAPSWLDELPLDAGPPHVRIGTRRVGEAAWLTPDEDAGEQLQAKQVLLAERPDDVVAVAHDADTGHGQRETLDLVSSWQRTHGHGDPMVRSAAPRMADRSAGATPDWSNARDLVAAACLVQEDLCLMTVGAGPPRLTAAVVCFPSYWRLADKIGHTMATMHAPVTGYTATLGNRPDRLLEGLDGNRIVSRRNWSVHDSGDLFAPVRPTPRPVGYDEVPTVLWLRSERQTLRRLPESDVVLFTIKVQHTPLASIRQRPDVAERLAGAIRAEAPSRADRVPPMYVPQVLHWLDDTASGAAAPAPG